MALVLKNARTSFTVEDSRDRAAIVEVLRENGFRVLTRERSGRVVVTCIEGNVHLLHEALRPWADARKIAECRGRKEAA